MKKKYPGVLLLGLVSFFADISSEMLYPITPIFLTSILGSSMLNVGIIEGFAEGIASLLKTYSGFWSDKINRRKPFILFGYLISALSRPLIGLSTTSLHVLGARSFDRIGKGLRSAPRDALIADLVDEKDRGLAFGWHRSIDTMGAVVGPLLALLILKSFTDIRDAYYWSVIPGLISVSFIMLIKEPQNKVNSTKKFRLQWSDFNGNYKQFIGGWTIFCLTNSSDAFLILKMKHEGLNFSSIILIYAFYNLIYAVLSPYLGHLSDRFGQRKILMSGLFAFSIVYFGFAFAKSTAQFVMLFTIYGAYMAATDGVSKAYALGLVKPEIKGSALGLMGTFTGVAQIIASVMTGYIWDKFGSQQALLFSCMGSITFLIILMTVKNKQDL